MLVRKPALIAAAGSVLLAGILLAASTAQETKSEKKTAREVYKNIKVFPKDLPADQVIPIMHKINDSLGVKCDFCHVIETDSQGKHVGWEKDDKKMKLVARDMIVMTGQMRAKQKYLKEKASCFMCHHGKPEPETNAPESAPRR
jgi:Photosynthetic reaction centre cytochrome C subunit.